MAAVKMNECHCEGEARGNPYSFTKLVLVGVAIQLKLVIPRKAS